MNDVEKRQRAAEMYKKWLNKLQHATAIPLFPETQEVTARTRPSGGSRLVTVYAVRGVFPPKEGLGSPHGPRVSPLSNQCHCVAVSHCGMVGSGSTPSLD